MVNFEKTEAKEQEMFCLTEEVLKEARKIALEILKKDEVISKDINLLGENDCLFVVSKEKNDAFIVMEVIEVEGTVFYVGMKKPNSLKK